MIFKRRGLENKKKTKLEISKPANGNSDRVQIFRSFVLDGQHHGKTHTNNGQEY